MKTEENREVFLETVLLNKCLCGMEKYFPPTNASIVVIIFVAEHEALDVPRFKSRFHCSKFMFLLFLSDMVTLSKSPNLTQLRFFPCNIRSLGQVSGFQLELYIRVA